MLSLARDENYLHAGGRINWKAIGARVRRDSNECRFRYQTVSRYNPAACKAIASENTLPPPPPGAVEKFNNFVHSYRRDSSGVWYSYSTEDLAQIRNVMIQVCLWLMCVCACPANVCVFYVCLA